MPIALTLTAIYIVAFIWLLGILRALYLYFRWLRFQKWYWCCLLLLFANLGPLVYIFQPEILHHYLSTLEAVLVVLSGIGGICMLMYLSASGMVHGILLCGVGVQFWRKLNCWHRMLVVGCLLELLVVFTLTGAGQWLFS
ncbi:MAG: hypothetical protein QM758_26390 [Armatimonas sp.]